MWQENSQLNLVAANASCPAAAGVEQLTCLRERSGSELRAALLTTGAQFQPVTDNVTVYMEYVLTGSCERSDAKKIIATLHKRGAGRLHASQCS